MSSDGVDGLDDLSVIDTGEFILVAEKQPVFRTVSSFTVSTASTADSDHLSKVVTGPPRTCQMLGHREFKSTADLSDGR